MEFNTTSNQYGAPYDLEDALVKADDASTILDKLVKRVDKEPNLTADELREDLVEAERLVAIVADEIFTENDIHSIDDWKDLIMAMLPDNASVAMVNDVEEALARFTHFY